MIFYHSTSAAAAAMINREGFRDGDLLGFSGVCVSDRPLSAADGVARSSEVVFAIEMPNSFACDNYEIVEEGRPADAYREWLIPAAILNGWMRQIVDPWI